MVLSAPGTRKFSSKGLLKNLADWARVGCTVPSSSVQRDWRSHACCRPTIPVVEAEASVRHGIGRRPQFGVFPTLAAVGGGFDLAEWRRRRIGHAKPLIS